MTTKYITGLALCLALALGVACSSDDGGGAGEGNNLDSSNAGGAGNASPGGDNPTGGDGDAPAGDTGDTGDTGNTSDAVTGGGAECVNDGEENFDCPFNLPPISGSCAPKGSCCHRASNTAKMAALGPDEPMEFEYRLNFVEVTNHPLTISQPILVASAQARSDICSGEQCLLWRFTAPRAGGELVAGAGKVEIGIGAYNCDGTYSYYGPNAAPSRDGISDDPGRWQSEIVDAEYDPAKSGIDAFHIPWEGNKNRAVARSVFLEPADNSIDWELASSGFEIMEFDHSEVGFDCMGERQGLEWNTTAGFVSYSPMEGNDADINNLISQTYCSLLAFGIVAEGDKDRSCTETERCMPGSADCPWVKLPDSLCPSDEAERAIFGCHLGAEGNPNGEEGYPDALNCTQEAPTDPLDPDQGATSDGQCCDPLGQSATLPACNAYRTVQVFVAAAAEITDEPRDSIPSTCQ